MTMVSTRLPPDLTRQLDSFAAQAGVSRAEAVRSILRVTLEAETLAVGLSATDEDALRALLRVPVGSLYPEILRALSSATDADHYDPSCACYSCSLMTRVNAHRTLVVDAYPNPARREVP